MALKSLVDSREEHGVIDLYHGSDHVVDRPLYGVGNPDNGYGSGFYTTEYPVRAEEWALLYGDEDAFVSH